MDFVCSVVSFEQSLDKFPFSSSSSSSSCTNPSCEQQHNAIAIADAFLLAPSPPLCNVDFTPDFPTAEVGLAAENNNNNIDDDGDNDRSRDYKRKKIIHRDAEKKRRHEMAALHRSLRSFLPVEHLKGKRAMSDQIDEAVNYIRHLQKRNEELRHKRDELKERLSAAAALNERRQSSGKVGVESSSKSSKCSSSSASEKQKQGSSSSSVRVEISCRNKLVQVVVSTAIEGGVPASTLLKALFQQHQGLSLITCISTTLNQTLLVHTVHSQVNEEDSSIIDPSELQKRLTDLITSTS
ncbi:transcription factor bHLH36-like [Diospyros lotus]|uniref:transcription factor bHLH36-like n=1 Tax=Diospyros lotus TaxID=55363 RepID=UPI00225A0271|nr:transcription factor bHLH36-like [Diospyros lotus]